MHPERQDFPVGVQRQFVFTIDIAAMHGREKLFAAVGGPFHRTFELQAAVGQSHVFRVGAGFHAEAAAHVAQNHADLFFVEAQAITHAVTLRGVHLAGEANGQAARGGIKIMQGAAWLDGQGMYPLVVDAQFDDMRRLGKRLGGEFGLAVAHLGGDVVAEGFTHAGRTGRERGVRVHHHRQIVVFDHDGLTRITRLLDRICHYRRDRFADEARTLVRQCAPWRRGNGAAVGPHKTRRSGQGFHTRSDQISARNHQMHPRHASRTAGVH